MYIRFVTAELNAQSGEPTGIFTALYALERRGALTSDELSWFREVEAWFNSHLNRPGRLAWSRRPHAPERAVTWLKASAREHVSRMRGLVSLLQHKDIRVEELRTERPGYILYEDDHQVAAIPFAETP